MQQKKEQYESLDNMLLVFPVVKVSLITYYRCDGFLLNYIINNMFSFYFAMCNKTVIKIVSCDKVFGY